MKLNAKLAKQIATKDVEYFLESHIESIIYRAATSGQRSVVLDITTFPPISIKEAKYVSVAEFDAFIKKLEIAGYTINVSATRPNTRVVRVEW